MARIRSRGRLASLGASALCLLALPGAGRAERLEVAVEGDDGPVGDAVVYALPLDGDGQPLALPAPVEIDQVDKEYVPYVTAIRVGTSIRFPNHDQIRHHVYSFSKAKSFEIPLYKGMPPHPIRFDKTGPVVLGCNIHDWMRAYVFVTNTPYFAVSAPDGRATVLLPPGPYAVRVWHPEQKGEPEATTQNVSVAPQGGASLHFAIEQKRVWRPRRAPAGRGGRYP